MIKVPLCGLPLSNPYPVLSTKAFEYLLDGRSLLKYLYRQVERAQKGDSSIFQRCSTPGEVRAMSSDTSCYLKGQHHPSFRPLKSTASMGGEGTEGT